MACGRYGSGAGTDVPREPRLVAAPAACHLDRTLLVSILPRKPRPGDPEPEFADLDTLLEQLCPQLTFLKYKKTTRVNRTANCHTFSVGTLKATKVQAPAMSSGQSLRGITCDGFAALNNRTSWTRLRRWTIVICFRRSRPRHAGTRRTSQTVKVRRRPATGILLRFVKGFGEHAVSGQ